MSERRRGWLLRFRWKTRRRTAPSWICWSAGAVVDVGAVLAENERLRAFAAQQYDQLLEANAEIERLRVSVSTLAAQTVDAQGRAKYWKAEYNEGQRRLEIIQRALVEAGLIEGEWDGSEEEDTR